MRRRVQVSRTYWTEDGTRTNVKLREEPLLRFADPARVFHDSTLWGWGQTGRPIALVSLERYETRWSYELVSLSPANRVEVVLWEGQRWSPSKPGLVWQPFPDAENPAGTQIRRLSQMKALARRFKVAEEMPENQRYELRLMPRPVLSYSDPDAGLTDGAIFLFALGTNPEAVLLIECRRQESGRSTWYYAFTKLTTAAVTARLGGRVVWSVPLHVGRLPLREIYSTHVQSLDR